MNFTRLITVAKCSERLSPFGGIELLLNKKCKFYVTYNHHFNMRLERIASIQFYSNALSYPSVAPALLF